MKILLAVDGSPYTKRMLAYLAAHDDWLGSLHEYTVLHTVPAVPPRAAAVLDRAVLAGYYEDEAEKVFKPIRTFFGRRKMDATYVAKVGAPGDTISKFAAQTHPDLLVMGSHGHSSLANLVLGSVATKVLAHCKTPVMLVR